MSLYEQIKKVVSPDITTAEMYRYWLERLERGSLTRDENPKSHFGVYFLPYDPTKKMVFIVHHKKSGLWLAPGGHIDKGESLIETLRREIKEELGAIGAIRKDERPFLLTVTPIEDAKRLCKEHFDLWYGFATDGSDFNIDPREFHKTRWATMTEAENLVTDPPNIQALNVVEQWFINGRRD